MTTTTSSSSSARRRRQLNSLPPTETVQLSNGLSLSPRLKLLLTFFRSDPAVKPIDEWNLKLSLLSFLRSSLSLSVPDDDLSINKRRDLHKRKRNEPVASGTLVVRDLGFLKGKNRTDEEEEEDGGGLEKKFLEWRATVVDRLGGIELNLEGVRFSMSVEIPPTDDFEKVKRSWEDFYASQLLQKGTLSRAVSWQQPDTVVVRGVPSRWFAEPRVSSKPSMLVTHTIFEGLGSIRKLHVAGDDDLDKKSEETKGEILSGLQCKVWVQFETHDDFCNALKVLCGRSMQKEGSRLKIDYEVTWDKDGFFGNILQRPVRTHLQERGGSMQMRVLEAPRHQSQIIHSNFDGPRPKRFRD